MNLPHERQNWKRGLERQQGEGDERRRWPESPLWAQRHGPGAGAAVRAGHDDHRVFRPFRAVAATYATARRAARGIPTPGFDSEVPEGTEPGGWPKNGQPL